MSIRAEDGSTAAAEDNMSKGRVYVPYAQSFLWFMFLMTLIGNMTNVVELMFVDFIHGNPHRTQENAISMMTDFAPLIGVVAIVGSILVFSFSQIFQALLMRASIHLTDRRARFLVLFSPPITAIITWYCYEYLTPTDLTFGGVGADWTPFQHGLTLIRFLMCFAIMAPVTMFNFLYFEAGYRKRSKTPLLLSALAIAIIIGGVWGYMKAQTQYQSL